MSKFTKSNSGRPTDVGRSANPGLLTTVAALIIIAGVLASLQLIAARHGFSDPDVYYHLRMAELMKSGHIITNFPWLPYTTLAQHFVDLHLAFHFLLIPFTSLNAAPWANALISLLMFCGFGLLLRQLRVRDAAFWLLLLCLGSADFLYRISILKANTLSLLILFLSIIAIERRRYLWLFLLSALYVFSYGGFFILLGIAGLYTLSRLAIKKLEFKPLLVVLAGTVLAILLYHPTDLLYHLYNQTGGVATALHRFIPLGLEWQRYDSWYQFFTLEALVLGLFLAVAGQSIKIFRTADPEQKAQLLWLGSISIITFVAMLWSRRFVEYWVPFSVLFAAVCFSQGLQTGLAGSLKQAWQIHLEFRLASLILGLLALIFIGNNLKTNRDYLYSLTPTTAFAGASQWLVSHSQPKQIVFNTSWDEFPQLFYWNDKNYYVTGLDPSFLYNQNQALYFKWQLISDDNAGAWTPASLSQILKNDFQASYLFLENSRNSNLKTFLDAAAASSPMFSKVYNDELTSVYRIN